MKSTCAILIFFIFSTVLSLSAQITTCRSSAQPGSPYYCGPPMPPPPPPNTAGGVASIENMTFPGAPAAMPSLDGNPLPVFEPFVQPTDAFAMLGDSRTQFAVIWSQLIQGNDEGFEMFLKPFRTGCAAKTTVQDISSAGSTTEHWLSCLRNPGLSDACQMQNMHQRVVIMLGGNDVRHRSDEWRYYTPLLILGGVSGLTIRELLKNKVLNEIHSNFKDIVNHLRSWGKEIVVQAHYKVNPSYTLYEAELTNKYIAFDEGLLGLRYRLWLDYVEHEVVVWPGGWVKIIWGKKCWKFLFWKQCRPRYWNIYIPPVTHKYGGQAGVTFADIPQEFAAGYFQDEVHPNGWGFAYHAYYLTQTLWRKCWW